MIQSDWCIGLQQTLKWILAYFEDPRCPVKAAVDWSNTNVLHAIIQAVMGSKSRPAIGTATINDHVVPLVLTAFLSVFEFVASNPNDAPPIHCVHASGLDSVDHSKLWKRTVLLDREWPSRHLPAPLHNVTVALFDITIDPAELTDGENQRDGNTAVACEDTSRRKFRLAALREFADTMATLGVSAVMSQKIIPEYLQSCLAAKGILALDRLASSHIRTFAASDHQTRNTLADVVSC